MRTIRRTLAKPRNDLLDRLVYVALRVVSMAVHSWGPAVSLNLAKAAGSGLYHIDARHRKRAIANLRRSFPEKSERELGRIGVAKV